MLIIKQEQEKTENEKAEMRDKVQEEINMLQQNLKKLQQVSFIHWGHVICLLYILDLTYAFYYLSM